MKLKITISILLSFWIFTSANIYAQSRGSVNSYQEIFSFSESQTESEINNLIPLGIPSWLVNLLVGVDNGITGYKINYNTIDFNNNPAVATGLIIVPDVSCDVDILTYCHGTVFDPMDVPSNQSGAGDGMEILLGYYYASNGYLTVMPDYLGLGEAATVNHLYVDEKTEASATRDLIVAAKNLSNALNYDLTGELMMTGYSQGGHAGMSTFRDINNNPISGLSLEVAGLGSGPYNLSGSQYDMLINDIYYDNPAFLLYVLASCEQAYGNIYNVPTDILRQPYADLYTTHILGQTGDISWVPVPYTNMLQPGVYNDLRYNNNNPTKQCLSQSNVHDWYHTKPLEMYYCTGDETVTYYNSFDAENEMEDYYPWWKFWLFAQVNAAYAGWFDHGTCVIPYAVLNKLELEYYQSWCWWWLNEDDSRAAEEIGVALRSRMYYNLDIDVSKMESDVALIEIFSLDGKKVIEVVQPSAQNKLISIPVSALEDGLYGINITDAAGNLFETAALKAPVELLTHPEYDPINYNQGLNQIELDLSLLLDEVNEINIYDNGQRLDRINGIQENELMLIDASELPENKDLVIQVTTQTHNFFLPVTKESTLLGNKDLYVYPNPTLGDFTVESAETFSSIQIFSLDGKLMFSQDKGAQDLKHNFEVRIPSGIYQLVVNKPDGTQSIEKIIFK
jgi:hypothetical protein